MSDTSATTVQPEARNTRGLYVKTFGCQMNVYDSERMTDLLRPLGFAPVDAPEQAELVVLNTCHIRERATEKVFSDLGILKRLKEASGGRMRIVVAGCVAQAEGAEILRRQPAVDLVVGPQSYHRLPEMIARVSRTFGDRLATDFAVEEKFDTLPKARHVDGPSAFISVQEGCDKFCTFCVVPYTRGAEHSRPAEAILEEARALARQGVVEVVLIGQNVNAWHGEAPAGDAGPFWDLGRLIRQTATIGGIARIRYTTSHPRDMTESLISAHAEVSQLQPFLHLPVQSGSDRILKAMNRGHTAEAYLQILDQVRSVRPDIAIATDFIVGFPGETEEDFAATLDLAREARLANAFTFKYSPRPGTPAAELSRQVDEATKDDRLERLQALVRAQCGDFNALQVGRRFPVLFDRPGKLDGQALGYSPYQQPVHVRDGAGLMGTIAEIEIIGATQTSLTGVAVSSLGPAPQLWSNGAAP